MKIPKIKDN